MNGIEILNQYEVVATTGWDWSVFWTDFLFIVFFTTIIGMFSGLADDDITFGIVAGVIIGVLVGGIVGGVQANNTSKTYTTEYQVTISDDISLTEFYNRYDIIKQEGKIFTIQEKKVEEE